MGGGNLLITILETPLILAYSLICCANILSCNRYDICMKMLRQTAVLFQLFQTGDKAASFTFSTYSAVNSAKKALAMRAAVRMTNALLRDGLRQRRICSRVDLRSFKLTRAYSPGLHNGARLFHAVR